MESALRELWDITTPDGADRKYRHQIYATLPDKFWQPVSRQYRNEYAKAGGGQPGLKAANLHLGRVGAALGGTSWSIGGSDDAIREHAQQRAGEAAQILARCKGDLSRAYSILSVWVKEQQITPPRVRRAMNEYSAVARMCDRYWWRRQLRRKYGVKIESAAISLGMVNMDGEIYASNATVQRRKEQRTRNRDVLESMLAVNELGESFTLAELADLSVSNPVIRRGELMTRMAGFEAVAQELGHVAEFYTWTCPSRMHWASAKYDGTTPEQAHRYLTAQWAKARAVLAAHDMPVYGFRVSEPHHDGTPHWHMLLFMPQETADAVRATLTRYALQHDPDEVGAARHRFTTVRIDWTRGTATGYVAKYVAKNIDAYGVDSVDEDLFGRRDPAECAARVDAWASTWRIRQFQQIGGAPVTVWRELRRMDGGEHPELLERARIAADAGDWGEFTRVMGGPLAKRSAAPVHVATVEKQHGNRYGEIGARQIVGVSSGGVVFTTRLHQWGIVHKGRARQVDIDELLTAGRRENVIEMSQAFDRAGFSPPSESCQ